MTEYCVLVTRGGFGDFWLFDSIDEVRRHPLLQPGDSLLELGSLFPNECLADWPRFHYLVSSATSALRDQILERVRAMKAEGRYETRILDSLREDLGSRLWRELVNSIAQYPDADPDRVIDLVRSDRDAAKRTESTVMAAKKAAEEPKPAAPVKEKKEKAPPKPKEVRGHQMTAKMAFGVDKEGKAYGEKNNPKREGSASAARFAKYKPGKTLAQQIEIEGGPTLADLAYDSDPARNLITITD